MTTGDIANRLGVSTGTIRRWAGTFADFLSSGANPPKGETRHFSGDDFKVLTAVAYYSKKQHLKHDAIREKLKAGAHLEDAIPTPAELRSEEQPAQEDTPTPVTQAVLALQLDNLFEEVRALTNAQESTRRALSEQVDALQQQIDNLASRLGPLAQIDDLQTTVAESKEAVDRLEEDLGEMAGRQAEKAAVQAQQLAHLEQQVAQLQAMLVQRHRRQGLRRLQSALGHGTGKVAVQTISWVLFLIAALGVLYYLNLATVLRVFLNAVYQHL